MEDEGEPCFEGRHISSWDECGDYWDDDRMADESCDADTCSKCCPEESRESSDDPKTKQEGTPGAGDNPIVID